MKILTLLISLLVTSSAIAQNLDANAIILTTGPCKLSSGNGTPEGAVVGKICDTYWRTDTGVIYSKTSGSGNTGWTTPGGIGGSGTAGTIPKWATSTTLGDSSITDVAGNLTLGPSGDIILGPGGSDVFPATSYSTNLGSLQRKYLTLHAAELWVETLVAQNTIATIGGRVLIASTTLLTADVTTGAATITTKHNNLTSAAGGDVIYLEAAGAVEFMRVTGGPAGTGPYVYNVTRNLDGSGANAWSAGDAVLNTGNASTGFIDLYSINGIKSGSEQGPSIVGNVRNSTTYNDWSPRWAIGNLNGLYGYSTNVYGAAFGVPTGAWVKIDPTNGVRLGYNTNTDVQISSAGSVLSGWSLIPNYLFSGATSTARVGIHASDTATDVAFYAGDFNEASAPFRVLHNGSLFASNATISGNGSGLTSINGANIQTGTVTATQIAASTITAAKLSVTTLSSITANLGTITAGTISGTTINGSTINAGPSGNIVLNSSGLSIPDGTSVSGYRLKLGTAEIWGNSSGSITADNLFANGNLGTGGLFFASGTIQTGSLTGTGTRHVCVDSLGFLVAGTTTGC